MQPSSGRGDPGTEAPPSWSQPTFKRAPGSGYGAKSSESPSEPERYGSAKGARREAFPGIGESLRNIGQQFRSNPQAQQTAKRILDAHDKSNYFRHAGLGAALRYTLGIPQSAQHLRYQMERTRIPRNPGLNPQPLYARPNQPEPDEDDLRAQAAAQTRRSNRAFYRRQMDTSDLRRRTP